MADSRSAGDDTLAEIAEGDQEDQEEDQEDHHDLDFTAEGERQVR
jgi:hypothetical protein